MTSNTLDFSSQPQCSLYPLLKGDWHNAHTEHGTEIPNDYPESTMVPETKRRRRRNRPFWGSAPRTWGAPQVLKHSTDLETEPEEQTVVLSELICVPPPTDTQWTRNSVWKKSQKRELHRVAFKSFTAFCRSVWTLTQYDGKYIWLWTNGQAKFHYAPINRQLVVEKFCLCRHFRRVCISPPTWMTFLWYAYTHRCFISYSSVLLALD